MRNAIAAVVLLGLLLLIYLVGGTGSRVEEVRNVAREVQSLNSIKLLSTVALMYSNDHQALHEPVE